MTEWTSGQSLTLERNKDYFKAGVPKLDKINFQIGQEPVVNLLRLQKGEIDFPGDMIPPAKFTEVMSDPEWSKQVIVADQLQTGYVTMNVNIKPFDNVAVRQAVNMAINKDRIVQVISQPWRLRYGFHGCRAIREGRPQSSVTAVCSST